MYIVKVIKNNITLCTIKCKYLRDAERHYFMLCCDASLADSGYLVVLYDGETGEVIRDNS